MTKREFQNRLIKRFRKKTTGYVTIKINNDLKAAIRIYYMYGGRYHLKRVRGKKITDINLHGDIDTIYEMIVDEKEMVRKEVLAKKLKSKQLSLF